MKKLILLLLVLCTTLSIKAQCEISSFIENNYAVDGGILALREILSDPSDPDYDNPFVPYERVVPYLEKLSAVHANPDNNPRIDSLFNEFQFHVNPYYSQVTEYKRFYIKANLSAPWVQNLKDTGVSGYQDLDDFLSTYQLTVDDYFDSGTSAYFFLITGFDYLNIQALLDDILALDDITEAILDDNYFLSFNYTGVSYILPSNKGTFYAAVCDISIYLDSPETDCYFVLWGGDCFAGCEASEYRYVSVSDDCQTIEGLGVSENILQNLVLSPNPASDKIQIVYNGEPIQSYKIYSIEGKVQQIGSFQQTLDISTLSSGMYFLEVVSTEGKTTTKKFIKN